MNRIFILSVMMILFLWGGLALAGGLTDSGSIKQQFQSNELTLQKSLSNKLVVKKDDDSDLRGDIYEFKSKSPAKAFLLSLIVPGAGQYYVGSKVKAASFFAADIGLWTGYLVYHKKGDNGEIDYRKYADQWYDPNVYQNWWVNDLPDTVKTKYSHRLPWDDASNSAIRNREYYENIGKYDQFQMGWAGCQDSIPPWPEGGGRPYVSPEREHYLKLRQQANKYFSNGKTFAIVSLGNHLVSAFEAAIGARRFNQGTKQYSLEFQSKDYNGKMVPYLVMTAKF